LCFANPAIVAHHKPAFLGSIRARFQAAEYRGDAAHQNAFMSKLACYPAQHSAMFLALLAAPEPETATAQVARQGCLLNIKPIF